MPKFFYSTATCSTATHIVLAEAGFEFTGVEVSWQRNLNVDELAKVNPLGSVPALLLDSGHALTQSSTIMEYAADQKPATRLLAKAGSLERLETLGWVSFAGADFQKWFTPILGAKRLTSVEAAHKEMRTFALTKLTGYLEHLDKSLAGKDYIMGKDFSIADAYLFTMIGWCKWVELKTAPYKNVHAYAKRVAARPAVKRVLEAEGLTSFIQD